MSMRMAPRERCLSAQPRRSDVPSCCCSPLLPVAAAQRFSPSTGIGRAARRCFVTSDVCANTHHLSFSDAERRAVGAVAISRTFHRLPMLITMPAAAVVDAEVRHRSRSRHEDFCFVCHLIICLPFD